MNPTTATGHVVSNQGWAVAGATLTALGPDGRQVSRTVSDTDGSFILPDLQPGSVTLLVAAAAHEPKALPVVVPERERWDIGDLRIARQGETNTPKPGIWTIDPIHSSIRARAHHLGLGGVSGGFEEFSGIITVDPQFEKSRVEVEIAAASINTSNKDRDTHLRTSDFLDVERYPTLRYTSRSVEKAGRNWLIHGALTLLQNARPVTLTMEYLGSGPDPWGGFRSAYSATTELRRKDFNMNWNQAIGAGIDAIGTTLRVTIDLEATYQG